MPNPPPFNAPLSVTVTSDCDSLCSIVPEPPAFSLIVAPIFVYLALYYAKIFGEEKSRVSGLEITGVIPVAQGVGFLLEGVLAKDANALRAGLVLAMGKPK